MIIYKITNKINGKSYIGQTTRNVETRFIEHCSKRDSNTAISNAIEKYGRENFTIEIVFYASSMEELNKKEAELISNTDSLVPFGYNIKSAVTGHVHSEETKAKISQKAMGRIISQETRAKIGAANSGKKRSKETKQKMSISKLGVKLGPATQASKDKMSKSSKGKSKSKEHRINISKAHVGTKKPWSVENIKIAHQKNIGFKHSEESKTKMSKSKKKPVICHETGLIFESTSKAAKHLGCHFDSIKKNIRGLLKTCKGFTFSYLENRNV